LFSLRFDPYERPPSTTMSTEGWTSDLTKRLRLSAIALVLANLAPLAGVLVWQWSVSSIVILYWFENVVIGVINVLRMTMLSPTDDTIASVLGVNDDTVRPPSPRRFVVATSCRRCTP
jgi:hypothetical protein